MTNNNNNTKGNVMKQFDVKIVCPISGDEVTHKYVFGDRLRQNEHGETVFRYNDHHDSCEVISVVEVPQRELDAMKAYFDRFGTACE